MNRLLRIIGAGLLGGLIGFYAGVLVACDWLYPNSNLCGIYGVLLTGPLGLIFGLAFGWWKTKPKRP